MVNFKSRTTLVQAPAYTAPAIERLEPRRLLAAELAADLNPATDASHPRDWAQLGEDVYFFANVTDESPEISSDKWVGLWRTDATSDGTDLIFKWRTGDSFSNEPRNLRAAGGKLWFAAEGVDGWGDGAEVWVSDGTTAGTNQLVDLYPGLDNGLPNSSKPAGFIEFNGNVYFAASDSKISSTERRRLYVSDGTAAGTVPFVPTSGDTFPTYADPSNFVVSGGKLWFTTAAGSRTVDLWENNGSTAGTRKVRQIVADENDASRTLALMGNALYFRAQDSVGDEELWKVATTGGLPVRVADIKPGEGSSALQGLTVAQTSAGPRLFLVATSPTNTDRGLWVSNGTAAGTVSIMSPPNGISVGRSGLLAIDGGVIFTTNDGTHGFEPYFSNGTAVGTIMLGDLQPGSASSVEKWDHNQMRPFEAWGDGYFSALVNDLSGTAPFQYTIFKTDGTPTGTDTLVLAGDDRTPDVPLDGGIEVGSAAADEFVFSASTGARDREIWGSDGTPTGTAAIGNLNGNGRGSDPGILMNFHEKLLATGAVDGEQRFYFVDPATGSTTILLRRRVVTNTGNDPAPGGHFGVLPITTANPNGVAVFVVDDNPNSFLDPAELWRTDGTVAGTYRLPGVVPILSGSDTTFRTRTFGIAGEVAYFIGSDAEHGAELWRTDGTLTGTWMVKDVRPGTTGAFYNTFDPQLLGHEVAAGPRMFFAADDGTHGIELWVTDGTAVGTQMVIDAALGSTSGMPRSLIGGWDDNVYYQSRNGDGFDGFLWKTDGTGAGTAPVGTRAQTGFAIRQSTIVGERLFYQASHATQGIGVYVTDGTLAGTQRIVSEDFSAGFSAFSEFTEHNGSLIFTSVGEDTSLGRNVRNLWQTDGTAGDAQQLTQLNPGVNYPGPNQLVSWRGELYFAARDATHGQELWRIDSNDARGAVVHADINPGLHDSTPIGMTFFEDDSVYLAAFSPLPGRELFRILDVSPPKLLNTNFLYEQSAKTAFTFAERIDLVSGVLELYNSTTGQYINPADLQVQLDSSGRVAEFIYMPGGRRKPLPNGNYIATLPGGSVTDVEGNELGSALQVEFYALGGDANRDRWVDDLDVAIFQANYGKSPRVFSQGDFNYDGRVNLADWAILRAYHGTFLPPPGGSLFGDSDDSDGGDAAPGGLLR